MVSTSKSSRPKKQSWNFSRVRLNIFSRRSIRILAHASPLTTPMECVYTARVRISTGIHCICWTLWSSQSDSTVHSPLGRVVRPAFDFFLNGRRYTFFPCFVVGICCFTRLFSLLLFVDVEIDAEKSAFAHRKCNHLFDISFSNCFVPVFAAKSAFFQ